jgi:hypothetical protein
MHGSLNNKLFIPAYSTSALKTDPIFETAYVNYKLAERREVLQKTSHGKRLSVK